MGGNLRTMVSLANYSFHPIKVFGTDEVKMDESCLFLDLSITPPEEDSIIKMWEEFCSKKRYAYVIAEGVLKPEAKDTFLQSKAKSLNKTPEEILAGKTTKKGFKTYSYGPPEKVYGFFRVPVGFARTSGKAPVHLFTLHYTGSAIHD